MNRRDFVKWTAAAAAGAMSANAAFGSELTGDAPAPFEEATIGSLQAAMSSGKTSSRALTQWYLSRIATLDKKVNSIIEINPDALAIAAEMDRERRTGKVRGPLHGVPIVIKDNID